MPNIFEITNFIEELKVSKLSAVERERKLKDFLDMEKKGINSKASEVIKRAPENLISLTGFEQKTIQ